MSVAGSQIKSRIDTVIALARKEGQDEELSAHLARYICVLTSGFVEVSLKAILINYVTPRSHPDVVNYVESRLKGITNLNEDKVYLLLNSFRDQWAITFRETRSDEQKTALDSVITNRNSIAHGRAVDLTLGRVTDYYHHIVAVVDMIEKKCVK